MGTQLTIDLDRLTCGDLLRLADALRAWGVRPDTEVQHVGAQEGGPPRLQVSLPDSTTAHRSSPPPGRPSHGLPPQGPRPGPGHMSGAPVFSPPPFYAGPMGSGGWSPGTEWQVRVQFPGGPVGVHSTSEGFARWRSGLAEAIALDALSDASRGALLEIDRLFDPDGPEGRISR